MSGSPVVSLAAPALVPLFLAIPEVEAAVGRPLVLIGGLAVMCRLRRPYRATTDIDTVDRTAPGEVPALELLLRHGSPAGPAGVDFPTRHGAVRVDVLRVPEHAAQPLPADPNDRLYLTAHAWAAASASNVTVETGGGSVSVRVAEPGSLVAMKLQSVMNRPRGKAATDLLDIVRLVLDRDGAALTQLAVCEAGIAADAAWHARRWFDEQADSTYRTLRLSEAAAGTGRETLDAAGMLLLRALGR